ncbi:MAG: hypothetical protein HUJ42_02450 [Malacoplasma sp.]|nr:hypothetical protein [Malacoplasma sp.]
MFNKDFWNKYSINDGVSKGCTICHHSSNNYLLLHTKDSLVKVYVCQNCAIDEDCVTKEAYRHSLNEIRIQKDLMADELLVYQKYVNSNAERKNDYDKFKELWQMRKDIRDIDG